MEKVLVEIVRGGWPLVLLGRWSPCEYYGFVTEIYAKVPVRKFGVVFNSSSCSILCCLRELGLQEPLDTDKMRRSNRIGCAEFFQSFVASVKRILIRVEDLNQLCHATQSSLKEGVSGSKSLPLGARLNGSADMQEDTSHIIRPEIALIFDKSIFQTPRILAVPVAVALHLHHALVDPTTVEILSTESHLSQLSAPDVLPALKKAPCQ
uniref:Uncharacterized protein n=1 Tax=Physcomitrium patens TaxID=3218 RepID=A0A7I4BQ07_PHYPA